jgi:pimeloyl-ACP methyl ester carboxylesterase
VQDRPLQGGVALRTGVTLRYETTGPILAPPIVLLHAWAESLRVFDRLRPLLPSTVRVISADQRGHGQSDKPADGYGLDSVADDTVALIEALGLPPAVLVGTSSGGYVAQQVAVTHPERVAGLVLVGAPRSLRGHPPFLDEVIQLEDPIDAGWVRASLEWFPRFQEIPDWFMDDRVQDGVDCPTRALLGTLLGLVEASPPTEIGSIGAPTTILWGARDDLLPRDDADRLHAAIPGSRLVVYPDTGHLVLWEQPRRVASDVISLLRLLRWIGE